jgi:pimeloyl-ACP methyl ester carboxylesterase
MALRHCPAQRQAGRCYPAAALGWVLIAMKWLRRIGYAVLTMLVIAALALGVALWIYRDIPPAELEARYTSSASRFIHINGVRIHYRDEGTGPALLLLHGTFGNLLDWDPWVAALVSRYRVVRLDIPAFGLTGPDPSGDYSIARTLELTEKFAEAVRLKRFAIGGTSLGSEVAIRYAARHPDRVARLILLNPSTARDLAMSRSRIATPGTADVLAHITPRVLASWMLRSRAGNPSKITDEQVDQWYEMWMREGNRRAMLDRLSMPASGNDPAVMAQLRVPVFVLWGEADPFAPLRQATEFRRMLTGAPEVRFTTYPGVGCAALQEAGEATSRDVRAWLEQSWPPPAG